MIWRAARAVHSGRITEIWRVIDELPVDRPSLPGDLKLPGLLWKSKTGDWIWACEYIEAPQQSGICDRCGGRWTDYERPAQCVEPVRRAA